MLINKKHSFDSGDILTIKLISGEEIITKFINKDDTYSYVNRPFMLAMTQKGVELVPYLFSSSCESEIPILHTHAIITVNTDKQIADRYIELTTNIKLI